MLGLYHLPGVTVRAALDDPRVARLSAAWPRWRAGRHPSGDGALLWADGLGEQPHDPDACAPPVTLADGLRWYAPRPLPSLWDLAREDPARPNVVIRLRRIGEVTIPVGIGPVYGCGPKRGRPSSEFGELSADLLLRSRDKERTWTPQDDADVERLLFLAFRLGYVLTEEIWGEVAPYDLDEVGEILAVIWGAHPKASRDDGATSPPSPPG